MAYPPDYQRRTSFRQAENAGQPISTAEMDAEFNDISTTIAQTNAVVKNITTPAGALVDQFTQAYQAFAGAARFVAAAGQTLFSTDIPYTAYRNARTVFGWVNGVLVDPNLLSVASWTNAQGVLACAITIPATPLNAVVSFIALDSDAASRSERLVATSGQTIFNCTTLPFTATTTSANIIVTDNGNRVDPATVTPSNDGTGHLRVTLNTGVVLNHVVVILVFDTATGLLSRLADTVAAGNGASMVGVLDAQALFASTNVEGCLAETQSILAALITNLGATARLMHRDGKAGDGVTLEAATANLSLGDHKLEMVADGSAPQDAVNVRQLAAQVTALTDMLGLYLRADGTVPMSGDLDMNGHTILNFGQPQTPVGAILMFPSNALPVTSGTEEWARCDGIALSRTTYSALFAIIGTSYGSGDGVSTFNIPDFRGRVPVHVGTGPGGQVWGLNTQLGAEKHALTQAEMVAHTHAYTGTRSQGNYAFDNATMPTGSATAGMNTTTDLGAAHNNLQPSIGVTFIIKTKA